MGQAEPFLRVSTDGERKHEGIQSYKKIRADQEAQPLQSGIEVRSLALESGTFFFLIKKAVSPYYRRIRKY